MKSLRLFSLLDELRAAKHPVSSAVLAERLGVSVRTIYRDIASLQSIGAPIRGESGLGFQLEAGYFLPPLHFTADELEAVMLGMRLLSARNAGALHDAASRAQGKLGATLGDAGRELLRHMPMMAVRRDNDTDKRAEEWEKLIRLAIRERRILDIAYNSLNQTRTRRRIHPVGMTIFDDAWLLTAWCEVAEDFRNFRLDRIDAAEDTGEHFRPMKSRSFKAYVASL
ncbi:YafY family transcriptional regulator [Aurantiacibacter xanthus]|uniref:YafY family transcriptional regulator n=1 Tax=Aurantiacibacter xanthus TaxID=1784712 RepID=A0A3A1P143_9SPHN|nr:YafY family protein [Aurantiacibacter xanthus]RIV82646.1 YafY family transcriptional regulator [Aurantiacibacter xanthus]